MSILNNEGHDPLGLGNTPRRTDQLAACALATEVLFGIVEEKDAEIERLRAALREISEYGYDVQNDDAYPLKQIARAALGETARNNDG